MFATRRDRPDVRCLKRWRGVGTADRAAAVIGIEDHCSEGAPAGLSAAVITRFTETWTAGQRAFAARDLSGVDYVYLWADGIVRHEAPHDRVGVEDLHRLGCRGSRVKLRAA